MSSGTKDYFGYSGKTCVITGAASGVGRALADMLMEAGADVWAVDMKPVTGVSHSVIADLRFTEQIDAAAAQLPEHIDCLFSNAALPGVIYQGKDYTELEVFTVNYLSARYIIELLAERMKEGSTITVTASITGEGWKDKIELLEDLYGCADIPSAIAWAKEHFDDPGTFDGGRTPQPLYVFTKECLIYYVKRSALKMLKRGIRINCLSPGAIDTPMTEDFGKLLVQFKQFEYMEEYAHAAVGPAVDRSATAHETAMCLFWLGSEMTRVLSGADLAADFGFQAAYETGICTAGGLLIKEE